MISSPAQTPRWRQCTGSASGSFASPIGNMYVTKHFNQAAKQSMNEMVKDIRAEMEVILSNIDWMDDKTRGRAKDKLRTMKEYIGYPEEILQVTKWNK
jgi:predicted metalloendopeptidase